MVWVRRVSLFVYAILATAIIWYRRVAMRISIVTKVLLFSVSTGCLIVALDVVFAIGALVKLSREAHEGVSAR